jgi:hypothetical protein
MVTNIVGVARRQAAAFGSLTHAGKPDEMGLRCASGPR